MLAFEYENIKEDAAALVEFVRLSDENYAKRKKRNIYFGSIFIFFLAGGMFMLVSYWSNIRGGAFLSVGAGVVGALFTYFRTKKTYKDQTRKTVEKMYEGDSSEKIFCKHSVTINEKGFSEKSEKAKNSKSWKTIHKAASSENYIFVLFTKSAGFMIPKRELGDEKFQEVIAEIGKYKEIEKTDL